MRKAPAPHGSPGRALVLPTEGALRGFCRVCTVQNFLHPDVKALLVMREGSLQAPTPLPRTSEGEPGGGVCGGASHRKGRGCVAGTGAPGGAQLSAVLVQTVFFRLPLAPAGLSRTALCSCPELVTDHLAFPPGHCTQVRERRLSSNCPSQGWPGRAGALGLRPGNSWGVTSPWLWHEGPRQVALCAHPPARGSWEVRVTCVGPWP